MTNNLKLISLVVLTIHFKISVLSQNSPLSIITKKEKGIEAIQKDSLFSIQFQFRMQNRAGYMSTSESDFTPEQFEFRVRRLRMRFKGFVINPKINYHVQLSFSRGDMDWDDTQASSINSSPNIVRDAVISYNINPSLQLGFGQTKLPGNRQRVVSSGNLQFADRSIVNSTFTLDRDFGFFGTFQSNFVNLKGAVTSGEGRNSSKSNKGLNYTGRIEIQPFGKFTQGNDECEGDLAREKLPKVSFAATYNFNDDAMRSGGTLGNDLYKSVDITNIQLDALFKYKGFAFYQEYLTRNADDPITVNDQGKIRYVYTGFGLLSQASYLFKNNFEIAGRFAVINPTKSIYDNSSFPSLHEKRLEQWQLGITKYIYGHRLKVQGNLLYHIVKDIYAVKKTGQFGAIFQIELGI